MSALELEKQQLMQELTAKRDTQQPAGEQGRKGTAAGFSDDAQGIEETLRHELTVQREVAVRLRVSQGQGQ